MTFFQVVFWIFRSPMPRPRRQPTAIAYYLDPWVENVSRIFRGVIVGFADATAFSRFAGVSPREHRAGAGGRGGRDR